MKRKRETSIHLTDNDMICSMLMPHAHHHVRNVDEESERRKKTIPSRNETVAFIRCFFTIFLFHMHCLLLLLISGSNKRINYKQLAYMAYLSKHTLFFSCFRWKKKRKKKNLKLGTEQKQLFCNCHGSTRWFFLHPKPIFFFSVLFAFHCRRILDLFFLCIITWTVARVCICCISISCFCFPSFSPPSVSLFH